VRVFIDNNLPPRLAKAINCLVEPDGHNVIHLRERFAANTPDVEWIAALGREGGWIIITADHDIVRRQAEKVIWRQANLVAFLLSRGWAAFGPIDQAWRLIKLWPNIEKQVELAAPGSVYSLTPSSGGRIGTI
jgi:hypothetical protein